MKRSNPLYEDAYSQQELEQEYPLFSDDSEYQRSFREMWKENGRHKKTMQTLARKKFPAERYLRVKTYRNISFSVLEDVKHIAEEINMSFNELIEIFLEYAIAAYFEKQIVFSYAQKTCYRSKRLSLFPFSGAEWAGDGWSPSDHKSTSATKRKAKNRKTASFRISDSVHEAIMRIAGETYMTGEIVSIFLQHAIVFFRSGLFKIAPGTSHPLEK